MSETIFRYDGSFDGFLTAVFDIYNNKWGRGDSLRATNATRPHLLITSASEIQAAIDTAVIEVVSDIDKAVRVEKGIIRNIGRDGFGGALRVFASNDAHKDIKIYNFLRLVFTHGRKSLEMLGHPHVITYNEIMDAVNYECHRMKGFVRFRETAGGVMYAPIRPDHDIVEFIMPHFAKRFHIQKFAIYDVGRKKLGLWNGKAYAVDYIDELPEIRLTDEEIDLQRAWKMYYDTVTIKSRESERRRKGFMPKRYWEFMPEITNDADRS